MSRRVPRGDGDLRAAPRRGRAPRATARSRVRARTCSRAWLEGLGADLESGRARRGAASRRRAVGRRDGADVVGRFRADRRIRPRAGSPGLGAARRPLGARRRVLRRRRPPWPPLRRLRAAVGGDDRRCTARTRGRRGDAHPRGGGPRRAVARDGSRDPGRARSRTSGSSNASRSATTPIDVTLLPTFVGCPALDVIRERRRTRGASTVAQGRDVRVAYVFDPPWTTDRVTEAGREALKLVRHRARGRSDRWSNSRSRCPHCGSLATHVESDFGPTPCRTIRYCDSCRNPFEGFKPNTRRSDDMADRNLFINGESVPAEDGKEFPAIDPSTGETIAMVAQAGAADAAKAIAAARAAFDDGRWSGLAPAKRATIMNAVAAGLKERSAELAELESRDSGRNDPQDQRRRVRRRLHVPNQRRARDDLAARRRDASAHADAPVAQLRAARADRRVRADHPVELPAVDGGVEDRARRSARGTPSC